MKRKEKEQLIEDTPPDSTTMTIENKRIDLKKKILKVFNCYLDLEEPLTNLKLSELNILKDKIVDILDINKELEYYRSNYNKDIVKLTITFTGMCTTTQEFKVTVNYEDQYAMFGIVLNTGFPLTYESNKYTIHRNYVCKLLEEYLNVLKKEIVFRDTTI